MKIIYIPDFLVVLKSLEDGTPKTVVDIQYDTRISYAHAFNIKKVLLNKGWISMTENGLRHELTLTGKGKEIVQAINMLLEKMEITRDNLVEYRQITKHKKDKKETPVSEEQGVSIDPNQIGRNEETKEEVKQEVVENEDIDKTVL